MIAARSLVVALALLHPAPAARPHNVPSPRPPAAPMVVSVEWLAQHYKDRDVVLFQVGEPGEYMKEHIPGARYLEMMDLSLPQGHSLDLPQPEVARADLERLGVSDNSHIVIYYGTDWFSPSTRLIHSLNYLGLGDRVSLLTGGMQAWKKAGQHVTDAPTPKATRGSLSAVPTKDVTVTGDWVAAHLNTPGIAIVDARAGAAFDGMARPGTRGGHIPGAHSLPFTDLFDDDLTLDSPAVLAEKFKAAGIAPGDTIIAYCAVGQVATAVVFAARVLGRPVKLYDGSMDDWMTRPGAPLETSTTTGH